MKYKALDGTELDSIEGISVSHTFKVPDGIEFTLGTFESIETSSKSDNSLQQIKIVRVYQINGNCTVTITEQTPEQITEYFNSLNQ